METMGLLADRIVIRLIPSQANCAMFLLCLFFASSGICADTAIRFYQFNCLGCHPTIEQDNSHLPAITEIQAHFWQTPLKRKFFLRLPAERSTSSTETSKQIAEIKNWSRACPMYLPDTPFFHDPDSTKRSTGHFK